MSVSGNETPEGQQQAGESTGARMSGGSSDDSMAWRRHGWDDATADDESDMDPHRQSASHDGHGWDRGGDRWHSWSRDDRDGEGRGDMRGDMQDRMRERMQGRGMGGPGMGMGGMGMGGMGMEGMGAMMGMRPPVGAFFNVQVGDARVTVRCAVREQTSAWSMRPSRWSIG